MRNSYANFFKAIVNSYAIIFFSQSRVLGWLLLLVSFFNVTAGASGLLCAIISVVYATYARYDKQDLEKGIFSFNALLLGIGFGTFYQVNQAFVIWLLIGCLLCIFITVNFWAWFNKRGLPFLSLPFIITFWVMLSAANSIFQMGLQQNSSAILNELNDADSMHNGDFFGIVNNLHFRHYPDLFFKALSAVFFQNSTIAGLLIAVGILIWSRIAMSVLILCFTAVIFFNHFTGIYPEEISHYHLGSNFMITAMAIGSFFLVASWRSYLWSIVAVLLTVLLVNAFTRMVGMFDLPVLSLPFCVICILLLMLFKTQQDKIQLTPFQYYSPEKNLYQYLNSEQRLSDLKYFDIQLPFMGSWLVSQGYNGNITHKDEWGQALDFVIADEDNKTYKLPGTLPEHYYCFNKPVLACGDGVVTELIDHVEDNEINNVNLKDNWGNTIVIKHTDGLYSKVSHLKKGSMKVVVGSYVKQGDILALCGNSGRSPEPHLHFQLQATPYIGSKTLAYPFSCYMGRQGNNASLETFAIPNEGDRVKPVTVSATLKSAFNFQPGYVARLASTNGSEEVLEVHTDAHQQTYFYSRETGAIAYFISNGIAFYFTGFYGDESSLLHSFYLAAYKVMFMEQGDVKDVYPLPSGTFNPATWLQDVIAPFYRYIKFEYINTNKQEGNKIIISSAQRKGIFGKDTQIMNAAMLIDSDGIRAITVTENGSTKVIQWQAGNI